MRLSVIKVNLNLQKLYECLTRTGIHDHSQSSHEVNCWVRVGCNFSATIETFHIDLWKSLMSRMAITRRDTKTRKQL